MNIYEAHEAYLLKKDVVYGDGIERIVTKIKGITAGNKVILEHKDKKVNCQTLERGWKTYGEELRDKVRDLENRNKDLIRDKEHWNNLYNGVESRYREYRDWLIELKMIESSPETAYSKTREEWKKIREQENGKD